MKIAEAARGGPGAGLEQFHVEQKAVGQDVLLREEGDERLLAAELFDVQRDGGGRMGAKERAEIFGKTSVRGPAPVVRDIKAAIRGAADVGLNTPTAIERGPHRFRAVFGRWRRSDKVPAMSDDNWHVAAMRRAAS